MKNRFLVAVFLLLSVGVFAQVTYPTNDPNQTPIPLGFLGWDDNNNTTLRVRQNDRVRIWLRDTTYNHVNDGTLQNVTRMAIHQNTSTSGIPFPYASFQPASMLHIGKAIPQALVRSWMNIGTTYGVRHDGMYVGIYEVPDDVYDPTTTRKADAVIAWGCNKENTIYGPDNMRFIFIAPTNGVAGTGPDADDEGQEVGRFTPEGNFGIGNFYTNGLDEAPSQRLDVDGTARLRQVPNENPDVLITGVLQDIDPQAGDYVLNHLEFSGNNNEFLAGDGTWVNGSSALCDWEVIGNDVAAGYPGGCVTDKILMGTNTDPGGNTKVFATKNDPGITMHVEAVDGSDVETAGYFIAANAEGTWANGVIGEARNSRRNYGVDGYALHAGQINYGIRGTARDGRINYGGFGSATDATTLNYGLYGVARGGEEEFEPSNNVGVYGRAWDYASEVNFGGYFVACDAKENIGVYAETCDHGGVAVYSVGQVVQTTIPIALSDESVKTGMENIEGSLSIINQLNPKQYLFNNSEYPHLNLSDDLTYGFSAQEVQEVLPDIVEEFHHPAKYDTSGEMISPSEDLLGIQYQEFIAILTAGIKEQQAQISEQEQTIDDLQQSLNNQNDLIAQMMDQMDALAEQVNDCCDGGFKYNHPVNEDHGNLNEKANPNGNILEQNIPNPFRSQTNIRYTLEQGGKVLLNIFDKTGKRITTLVEAEQQAGNYRYEWDASGLPAGLYHYALYVDGELLVKKAIKLQD